MLKEQGSEEAPVLWSWSELSAALCLDAASGPDILGFCIDSRRISQGDLFVAIPADLGGRFNVPVSPRDGHDFVAAALAGGAAGALVSRLSRFALDGIEPGTPGDKLLVVDDCIDALWTLGRVGRQRASEQLFAITGSSGKTTAKEFLAEALACLGATHRSAASLNNHLGVPLTLASIPKGTKYAVVEIGTNHPGEIGPLSDLAAPTVSILLNVQRAHIGNFVDIDELRAEKTSIISGLKPESPFVVHDEIAAKGLPSGFPIVTFGDSRDARVRCLSMSGDSIELAVDGRRITASVPGGGRHRGTTVASVVAAMLAAGLPIESALELSASLVPAGRGSRSDIRGVTVVDDSYNANPDSMAAALSSLPEQASGTSRRVAIVGDMLELGEMSEAAHRGLASSVPAGIEVLAVGPEMRNLYEALPADQRLGWHAQAADIDTQALADSLSSGDVVLVKGSNLVFWASGWTEGLRDALGKASR
ncbi:MAG: UDP-N-acetylmuramoyl-tripeptide--D-alanyl-D-alanine ligase [Pseudomonadaceae bacterium]|nr:UDP-N-acetylmuramoyl-tripeptide--D-alanyl-D-alanine ligase [Pseudomonadaceae bacterium]